MKISMLILALAATSGLWMAGAQAGAPTYVTWETIEPDKCIAAWLIRTHVATNAVFKFVPKGTPITNGIPFDVPGSTLVRDARRSASEVVIDRHKIKDAKALSLGRLARKMELGFWHASYTQREQPLAEKLRQFAKDPRESHVVCMDAFAALSAWKP